MMMKNVAIATDSHSSITPEMAQTLGVAVLPMPFTIDGTCYLEEETLTARSFMRTSGAARKSRLPSLPRRM